MIFDGRVLAVVGAGPFGLMAAFDLAKKGYLMTIFEAGPEPSRLKKSAGSFFKNIFK
ncbi:MAG: NAD(P)-binding protein [Firmicutes bacterium]|nr:NAD(P)-binding protein [Bacillota bacterium]